MFKRISIAVSTAAIFAIVISSGLMSADALAKVPGNNGTIKVHEQGTPSGTENNDPKVCTFNIEAFGLDAGQQGFISFAVQGGDKPTGTGAGPYAFGPTDATGYVASQYFHLSDGHYKVTLYGKDTKGNVDYNDQLKAKSKVFKVSCDQTPVTPAQTQPEKSCDQTPEKPATPEKPTNPVVAPASTAAPTQRPVVATSAATPASTQSTALPAELPMTGTDTTTALPAIITILSGIVALGAALVTKRHELKKLLHR